MATKRAAKKSAIKRGRAQTKFEVPYTVGDRFYLVDEFEGSFAGCDVCDDVGYLHSDDQDEDFTCPACEGSGRGGQVSEFRIIKYQITAFTIRLARCGRIRPAKLAPQVFYRLDEMKVELSTLQDNPRWCRTKREAEAVARKLRMGESIGYTHRPSEEGAGL